MPQSLLVSNGIPAPVFTLAGATNPACNGIYTVVGEVNWEPLYKLTTGNYWLLYFSDEEYWMVTNQASYGGAEYFRRENASEFGAYANNTGTGNVTFSQN